MSVPRWLTRADAVDRFPSPNAALSEPNGLLAVGGDLEPNRLLGAYVRGIFPWYEEGQPILWWSPDPRAVLWPADLHVSRSLRRSLIKGGFELRVDTAFGEVLAGCAAPRRYTDATWITADMAHAYGRLHHLGWAHSFETWRDGELVGGLYGVAIGRVFFGESMFARVTDASKVALVGMVRFLEERDFALIDCQVASEHITTLGARTIPRREFLALLARYCTPAGRPAVWRLPAV
ncbi:MAG TPA: leucyl/phenylalanyl-tRNA--protein transferase [Gammaproteobacteria bacterium]|nr:leucyl/phenylalanyl-tRNA--protein transferase [Gammaproteobacteria bacterium]